MDVFDLKAIISLDSSKYEEGLNNAEQKGKSFGTRVKSALGTAGKVGALAIGAVTTATTIASATLVKGVSDVASYGDNIDKMSQKMGMSAQAYQEWDAVMRHSGTSMETMKASMKTLANAAETGSEAFEQLGISQEEIAELSQEQLFERTIGALQNVEDQTQRTYLAGKLLGRGATELGALLNTSAEDTQAMRDRVRELGGVMSDEAVAASRDFQDQLQDMQTALQGTSRGMISEFLPSVNQVMSGLTEIFAGNGEEGTQIIAEGVSNFIEKMNEGLPKLLSVAESIFSALSQAILDNLPAITENGTKIVINLVTGIAKNLPQIMSAASTILSTIVKTLIDSIPDIMSAGKELIANLAEGLDDPADVITAILDVLTSLLENIIEYAPEMISGGIDLIVKLAQGLINGAPQIVAAIGQCLMRLIAALSPGAAQFLQKGIEFLKNLATGIVRGIPQVLSKVSEAARNIGDRFRNIDWGSVGAAIINGIANGIASAGNAIMSAALNAAKGALQAVKNFFGIKSPSKVFRDQVGKMLGVGMALGITDSIPGIIAAVDDMDDAIMDGLSGLDDYGTEMVVSQVDTGNGSSFGNGRTVYNYNTWNVDGAENPELFANRAVRQLRMKVRTA